MKQLTLFIAIFFLLTGISRAASVSGTVSNPGGPVPNQKVYAFDSLTTWKDSTLTSSSGAYSIPLPASVTVGHTVTVYTAGCGTFMYQFYTYTGSNITANFSICSPAATYTLHGTVSLSGGANNGLATVYLIERLYDSVLRDTVLTLLDSFNTASTGGAFTKTYTNNPSPNMVGDSLLLKVALHPSHPNYLSYVPTYYGAAVVWSNAKALNYLNFQSATATNITMVSGTNTGGPGFVGGSVLLGANKTTAVGDPLANRILILTNSSGVPLTYRYSDASGKFSFTNLATGTYKIFGDALGKANPALTFTLTSAKPGISNIVFEENSIKFEGRLGALTVTSNVLTEVSFYPNPVTDHISFSGLENIAGTKSIVLRDITGAIVHQQSFDNGQQVSIHTDNISAGIYLLQLRTDVGVATFRVVK